MDCVTAGAQPLMTAPDVLRAAAVMAAARESLRTGAPAAVDYSLAGPGAVEAAPAGAAATAATAAASLVQQAKALISGGAAKGHGTPAPSASRSDDEGGVSTPPHQGTPGPKAGPGTPESPQLLPAPQRA